MRLLLLVLAVAVVGGFVVLLYNKLVHRRVRAESAWADIDVQLKRRHDLIPNLVETVKGYAGHEQRTFEEVARLRSQAQQAKALPDRAKAEGELTQALRGLFAVAENYPQLRAAENFLALQQSLSEIEEALQNARRYYNAVVRDLNIAVQSFPGNLVAGMFGFQARAFFELESVTERQPAPVKF
ncbi:MAG: LemA family protein [Terriglobales bacterium]